MDISKMRRLSALLACVLVVTALAGCGGGNGETSDGDGAGGEGASGEPLKIGAVLSLSGTYAGLGEPEKNVFEMEQKRLNDAGGINGRPVQVLIEDDGTDEAKAVQAATKLIDQEKVLAILGATGTGQSMAIRQQLVAAEIPQLSMAGGNVITGTFDKWVFQTPWPNKLVVPFVLKWMQGKGYSKIGVLTDSGGYGKDGLAIIKEELPKYGMTAVADEKFNAGDTDMTSQLTKIKRTGAQAVLMWTAGKEASTIAKNAQTLNLGIPIVGGSGIARREFIEGAGDAANDVVFGTGKILIPASWGETSDEYKVAKDFVDRYTAEYGKAPDIFAGHAYDAFWLAVEAMKKLPEGFTGAQLRDEIEKTNGWVGIDGKFTFSATDHNGLSENDLVMYVIKDGQWTLEK